MSIRTTKSVYLLSDLTKMTDRPAAFIRKALDRIDHPAVMRLGPGYRAVPVEHAPTIVAAIRALPYRPRSYRTSQEGIREEAAN